MKKLVIFAGLFALAISASHFGVYAAEVPRKAPELTIPLPTGGQVKLSDYHGKVVALAFILTT